MAAWLAYNLNPKLVDALVACGFNSPTEIQEKSLQYAVHPVDLIIASKTVGFSDSGIWKNFDLPCASAELSV